MPKTNRVDAESSRRELGVSKHWALSSFLTRRLLPVLSSLAGPGEPQGRRRGSEILTPALRTGVGTGDKMPKGPFQWWHL